MLIGNELMGVLYKGYSVPEAKGRYIDRGMAFKKGEVIQAALTIKRSTKRKSGELRELALATVTNKWHRAKDVAEKIGMTPENIRTALERLVQSGHLESVAVKGIKKYRRKQCKT